MFARATIANAASLSDEVEIRGQFITLHLPAAWTAADLTFAVKNPGSGSFVPLRKDSDGTEVKITAAAMAAAVGGAIVLDTYALSLVSASAIKLRSGVAGAEVNQGGQRDFLFDFAG